jgi:hypothetical protein
MSLDSRWNHLEGSELSVENKWQVDRKSGAPMVKLFREKETGVQEAEVVLDDPRSATGIVNWFNGRFMIQAAHFVSFGD